MQTGIVERGTGAPEEKHSQLPERYQQWYYMIGFIFTEEVFYEEDSTLYNVFCHGSRDIFQYRTDKPGCRWNGIRKQFYQSDRIQEKRNL